VLNFDISNFGKQAPNEPVGALTATPNRGFPRPSQPLFPAETPPFYYQWFALRDATIPCETPCGTQVFLADHPLS
jgi:hypothetical protein